MKKQTLFVGDCDNTLASMAIAHDPTAVLIDSANYQQFVDADCEFTGYTSLADLPKELSAFYQLLESVTDIVYCPPATWSDRKTVDVDNVTDSIQGLTEYCLYVVHKSNGNVCGLDLKKYNSNKFLKLPNARSSNARCLWIAGCSTTAGVGVESEQKYGTLLSDSLNLPVAFLAEPGASISWTAGQILRSDIRTNDIVVWGLTHPDRLSFWSEQEDQAIHINSQSTNQLIEKINLNSRTVNQLLIHKTNLVTALQKINEVVNFCHKIQAKLLIFNIHSTDSLNIHLGNINEFFVCPLHNNGYIDIGNDNRHPGPKQHQAYAKFCQATLKKLQYI
jgi:hypothetical protein